MYNGHGVCPGDWVERLLLLLLVLIGGDGKRCSVGRGPDGEMSLTRHLLVVCRMDPVNAVVVVVGLKVD